MLSVSSKKDLEQTVSGVVVKPKVKEVVVTARKSSVGESPKPYLSQQPITRKPMMQTAEPTITIHIGHIEVYAVKEQEQPVSSPRAPVVSLGDYLKQRSEGA